MESIHALVNRLSQVYASLNIEQWMHSIIKSITALNE